MGIPNNIEFRKLSLLPKRVKITPSEGSLSTITRSLRNLKGTKATNFLFLLDQKLKKIPSATSAEEHVEAIINIIKDCVDKFAPERKVITTNNSDQWITNKIKNAVSRRNLLFQNWINNPTLSNQNQYKKF